MRPVERRAQRLLALARVAAALQQVEPLPEPLEDLPGREHARARGRELDRERQVVEACAELGDLVVRLEPGAEREQRHRLGRRERRQP